MNQYTINLIFSRFAAHCPEPKTELEFTNDFTLLVAIILSAQATDKAVNKATKELFKAADTPAKMLELGINNLKTHIRTIGLFNSKANNIIKTSQLLAEHYNSIIPSELSTLQSLPGVGRKTANVFLNCAHGEATIAVDTHVFRVSNRIGLVQAQNVLESERLLSSAIPDKWKKYAHHWLILHGRYICKARKPDCNLCLIKELCQYPHKTLS
jgi:endonuclease-3